MSFRPSARGAKRLFLKLFDQSLKDMHRVQSIKIVQSYREKIRMLRYHLSLTLRDLIPSPFGRGLGRGFSTQKITLRIKIMKLICIVLESSINCSQS